MNMNSRNGFSKSLKALNPFRDSNKKIEKLKYRLDEKDKLFNVTNLHKNQEIHRLRNTIEMLESQLAEKDEMLLVTYHETDRETRRKRDLLNKIVTLEWKLEKKEAEFNKIMKRFENKDQENSDWADKASSLKLLLKEKEARNLEMDHEIRVLRSTIKALGQQLFEKDEMLLVMCREKDKEIRRLWGNIGMLEQQCKEHEESLHGRILARDREIGRSTKKLELLEKQIKRKDEILKKAGNLFKSKLKLFKLLVFGKMENLIDRLVLSEEALE